MRILGTLMLMGMVAGVALADIPPMPGYVPPPIPKGKKYVEVKSEVVLSKDVTGYVFVFHEMKNPRSVWEDKYARAELSADKPFPVMPTGGRGSRLVAIPADEAKAFKTDAELFNAIDANKVKGMHTLGTGGGGGSTLVDETATKEKAVTWTTTITAIDPKDGIKGKTTGIGIEEPKPKAHEKKEDKKPLALAEPGTLVGGIALAVGVTLGGLWLVRRKR